MTAQYHLGSTTLLTDSTGNVVQALSYLPYGEEWTEYNEMQRPDSLSLGQYRFNGKERDPETGFLYYGQRYYGISYIPMWLSVDPLTDKYPGISPYTYCNWNPVKYVDPNGMEIDDYFSKTGDYLGSDNAKTNMVRIISQETWDAYKQSDGATECIDHTVGYANSERFSDASVIMDKNSQLKVYGYYNPTPYKLEDLDNRGLSFGMRTRFEYRKDPVIKIRLEGNSKENRRVCDYVYEIVNLFVHEKAHIDTYFRIGHQNYQNIPKQTREVSAVKTQMDDASWKRTRPFFQQAMIKYGKRYGLQR